MIEKVKKREIVVLQDHKITSAHFIYRKKIPQLTSVVTHKTPKNAIINGVPFDILFLFSLLQKSTIPLTFCLFSPDVIETVSEKNTAESERMYELKKEAKGEYIHILPSCCSKQTCYYSVSYHYALLMPCILAAARAKRKVHSMTFPLHALLSLFHASGHQKNSHQLLQQDYEQIRTYLQKNSEIRSFFAKSWHSLENDPALWYAFGAAYQESVLV